MTRKIRFSFNILAAALTIGVITLTVMPVMAAPPLDVHIEVQETISPTPDPFTATGPAVDTGVLCQTGDVIDLSASVSGPPGGTFRILRVLKQFVCDDGSGTFDVKLVVRLDLITHETTANWNVVGGTGAYVGLHGNGKLIGIPIVPGDSILDVYDGRLH